MQFDEAFFQSIGLGQASAEERAAMVEKLTNLVQGRVALRLTEVLTPEQLEQFDKVIEEQGDDAGLDYLMQVYPNYPQLLGDEVMAVKQQFTSGIDEAMQHLEDTQGQ